MPLSRCSLVTSLGHRKEGNRMTRNRRYRFVLPLAEWLPVLAVLIVGSIDVSAHQSHPNCALQLAWQSEHISRVTAVHLDARTSGAALFRATQAARVEQRDGRLCVVGAVLLFDVDDAFAFNIDQTVSVEHRCGFLSRSRCLTPADADGALYRRCSPMAKYPPALRQGRVCQSIINSSRF